MNRKDLELVARGLRCVRPSHLNTVFDTKHEDQWMVDCRSIAETLGVTGEARTKFMKACGVKHDAP